ncbi:MAG: hypothetical protein ACRDX9_08760 [Acidimicrobiia bacterium]
MRGPGDYMGEMFNATISDRAIESLLTGSRAQNGSLSDLAGFVEMLRAYEKLTPSEDAVERFATAAVAQVRVAQAPNAAPSAFRDRRARRPLGLRPQVAAMLTTVLLVAGSTGVAVAADGAAPGHGLYWLDRAVENIGIGDGRSVERLAEAQVLVAEGQPQDALTHVIEALDAADDDVTQARTAVNAAIEDLETDGAVDPAIDEGVTALLDYLSENIGRGIGVDGRELGQGVAEIARGITSDDETEVTEPTDEPAPGGGNQPEDDAGTNGNTGNGNGNSTAPGNGNGNSAPPGNGDGNSAVPGNGNGNGNSAAPGNGNGSPDPSSNSGNGNETGSNDANPSGTTDPPESGNPDPPGNGGGQGPGPPAESPSATAPGQVKKP